MVLLMLRRKWLEAIDVVNRLCGDIDFYRVSRVLFWRRHCSVNLSFTDGLSDEQLDVLRSIPRLAMLQLRRTAITGTFLREMVAPQLTLLDIGETLATDDAVRGFSRFTSLTTLFIDETRVTDEGLDGLLALKRLARIFVGKTGVSVIGIERLLSLPSLTYITAEGCIVSDHEKERLMAMRPDVHIAF